MDKQILGYKCKKCGHVHYPYRSRCRACGHTEWKGVDIVWDVVPLPLEGKLLTFTHAFALPADFETVSLTLGIVELDGGNRVTAQLDVANPRIGMRLSGRVQPVRKEEYVVREGLVFREAVALPAVKAAGG